TFGCEAARSGVVRTSTRIPGHEVDGVRVRDIHLRPGGGGSRENAAAQPAENENAYPEPTMFGPVMPSHGFFIRHARNVQLSHIEITYDKDDMRPPFVVQDVKGVDFFRVKAQHVRDAGTFALRRVTDFSVSRSRTLAA